METTTRPVHPEHRNTTAADCAACYSTTYGVALECAYDNMQDAGEDVDNHDMADVWARSYVDAGDVSAYYCHHHDPVNS